jgi:outer membrane receptor protein involved in Fe transport
MSMKLKSVVRKTTPSFVSAGLLLAASLGQASEPSKILSMEEVVVTGEKVESPAVSPSTTVIKAEELEEITLDKTLYVLQKVPGVVIQDYGQGAVASQFAMRGIRLGHNTGVAIFVDGVPINESTSHGDGYGDFNTIIPEDIEEIEVIKGPSSALYGQFARAGVVNIITKRSGNFGSYKLGAGDFDRQRFSASAGRTDGDLSSVLSTEISRSEGATDHSAWTLCNASGKLTYKINEALRAGLTLNLHSTSWDHPEYLTREQWENSDYWSAKALGSGERYRYGGSSNISWDISDQSSLNMMLYGYAMNLTRYRDRDTSVGEEYHDRDMYGGSFSHLLDFDAWGIPNTLTTGIDTQVELTHTINANNPSRIPSAREEITVDGDSVITTFSAYLQNQFFLSDWTITLGGRFDAIGGDLDDNLTNTSSDMETFNIFSPKAAIEYTPVDGYTLFATYGEGFKLPNGFDKFMYPDLSEETYQQYELGVRLSSIQGLSSTLTGFLLEVEDEIVVLDAEGTRENQGSTRRTGVELDVDYTLVKHLSVYGTLSYIKGEYVDYVNNGVDYSDTDISRVPEWLYSFGIGWNPAQGLFTSLDYRYAGEGLLEDYSSDYTGERKYSMDYWVADAKLGYRLDEYSLTFDVKNLFDERYPSYETASSLRTANPRGYFLTFAINY